MADVKFKGIVEKVLGSKGVKVVERHSKKNDAGEWETVGRTYFTVWVNEQAQPAEGDLITVIGTQKTVAEEYQGATRYNLHVSASTIIVEKSFGPRTSTKAVDVDDLAKYGNAPF
jgi:hypothetical protein